MKDEVHTTEAFRYHWLVWRWNGMKVPPYGSPWRIPYIVYALLLNLLTMVLVPMSLLLNCCFSQSIRDLCENLYITITILNCSLKFANVYLTRHDLEKVHTILEGLDLKAATEEERIVLREGIDSAQRWFKIFMRLILLTLASTQTIAYFSQDSPLTYPAYIPWDWQSNRGVYLLTNFVQAFSLWVEAILAAVCDTYPQAYLRILAAHIKALSMRLQKLGKQSPEGAPASPENQQRVYNGLIECIKDHEAIDSLFLTIQKPLSRTSFAQFMCSILAQCTLGMYFLYVGFDYTRLMNITIFLTDVTLETFILCYSGEMLCQEYLNLEVAIYSCDWIDQSQQFKKAILLLLQRAQKINVIKAGNIVQVRLPTFVQILRMAYAAFTVLNKFK